MSRTAIYRGLNDDRPRKKPDQLNEPALLEDVRRDPDKRLRERAKDFSMSIHGIWVALRRLGIKKNTEICRALS